VEITAAEVIVVEVAAEAVVVHIREVAPAVVHPGVAEDVLPGVVHLHLVVDNSG